MYENEIKSLKRMNSMSKKNVNVNEYAIEHEIKDMTDHQRMHYKRKIAK
jgi:hypothetical protein